MSVATWIALGDDYVRFGILHCIAVAMLVGPLLLRLAPPGLVLGVAVIAAGTGSRTRPASDAAASWVGFRRAGTGGSTGTRSCPGSAR